MLDLSAVKTLLEAGAPSLGQVILPDVVDVQGPDSAALLTGLIEPVVSSQVYAVELGDGATYPAVAYERQGASRIEVDGYPVLRDDTYGLAVWHTTYGAAHTAGDSIRTALQAYSPTNAAGAVDILDEADDFDPDLNLYGSGMQVRMTHLARATQTLPAAFLYPTGAPWEPGEEVTCVDGTDVSEFAVLLVAKIPAGGVSGLAALREEIRGAIVGQQVSAWGKIEPAGGELETFHSSFVVWKDLFSATQNRTYS